MIQVVLDVRTTVLVSAVVNSVMAAALVAARPERWRYPGLSYWGLALSLSTAGMFLLGLRGLIPDFFSVVLGNLLVVALGVFALAGLRVFLGLKSRLWIDLAFLSLVGAALAVFTWLLPDPRARIIVFSLTYLAYGSALWIVVRRQARPRYGPNAPLTAGVLICAAWLAGRILLTLLTRGGRAGFLEGGTVEALTIVVGLVATMLCVLGFVVMIARRYELELAQASAEVKTLKGIIPICASCKKIRDDQGYWSAVESYISSHTSAEFSHGICPECFKRLYPR